MDIARNAHQAISKIRKASQTSRWIVNVDIQGYFDDINHDKLMELVEIGLVTEEY